VFIAFLDDGLKKKLIHKGNTKYKTYLKAIRPHWGHTLLYNVASMKIPFYAADKDSKVYTLNAKLFDNGDAEEWSKWYNDVSDSIGMYGCDISY
jgi:murein endopeptidase